MSCNCPACNAPKEPILVSGSAFLNNQRNPFKFCPHRCKNYCKEECSESTSSSSSSSSSSCSSSSSTSSSSSSSSSFDEKRYEADFVVVGMGASGATIVRLLSDAGFSVIGIEAGGNYDEDPLIKESPNAPELEEKYGYKFFFPQETEPNPEMNDKVDNYTTGRMLGGGTSINGMQYVRGTDSIWARWAAINGPTWSPTAVSEAYRALENFSGISGNFENAVHGFDGMMLARQAPEEATSMAVKFANALATATGTSVIDDYNNPATPIGTFTRWSLFQKQNGNRASSSTDFLEEIVDKHGKSKFANRAVRILQNTTASKVLFDEKTRARAVEVIHNGLTTIVRANKEIILSAGIYSNEILQRSGVGPGALLDSIGIPVVYDNSNVGAHSKNHLINFAVFSANPTDIGVPSDDESALYVGGGFLPTPESIDPNRRGFQWIGSSPEPGTLLTIFYNLDPQSEGTDRLQNKDPLRTSAVAENLFSNGEDLDRIVKVFQQQIVALNTAFQASDPAYALISPPLSLVTDPSKIDELKEFIIEQVTHTHHWGGTCKMAPQSEGGIVASDGTVHGVRRLRVADVSVSAVQSDGNTAGPGFVIGYIIAQKIIQKHQK